MISTIILVLSVIVFIGSMIFSFRTIVITNKIKEHNIDVEQQQHNTQLQDEIALGLEKQLQEFRTAKFAPRIGERKEQNVVIKRN